MHERVSALGSRVAGPTLLVGYFVLLVLWGHDIAVDVLEPTASGPAKVEALVRTAVLALLCWFVPGFVRFAAVYRVERSDRSVRFTRFFKTIEVPIEDVVSVEFIRRFTVNQTPMAIVYTRSGLQSAQRQWWFVPRSNEVVDDWRKSVAMALRSAE
jgi:hypothetical protein